MLFLDFAHLESETANEMIERYETTLQNRLDQGVAVDNNMRQRMLIGRPAERYKFLKQNYLLATAANKPDLDALKAQLRDIDQDYRKPHGGAKTKSGQIRQIKTPIRNRGQLGADFKLGRRPKARQKFGTRER